MFSLTPEEKVELLRLMQLAQDCGQLYIYTGADFLEVDKTYYYEKGDCIVVENGI